MHSKFNPQTFVENSYKEHYIYDNRLYKLADKFFQKRIKDKNGKTKYFINVYHYLAIYSNVDSSIFQVHFSTENYEYAVEISSYNFSSFEEVEKFFEDYYKVNNCIPDKHNNDWKIRNQVKNMKIFVLSGILPYEDSDILGVYSSLEEAKAAKEKYVDHFSYCNYFVSEYILNDSNVKCSLDDYII